jgi:hypothetical protein
MNLEQLYIITHFSLILLKNAQTLLATNWHGKSLLHDIPSSLKEKHVFLTGLYN